MLFSSQQKVFDILFVATQPHSILWKPNFKGMVLKSRVLAVFSFSEPRMQHTNSKVGCNDKNHPSERSRLLKLMLQAKCDIELRLPARGETPLLRAASTGNLRAVCDLLEA